MTIERITLIAGKLYATTSDIYVYSTLKEDDFSFFVTEPSLIGSDSILMYLRDIEMCTAHFGQGTYFCKFLSKDKIIYVNKKITDYYLLPVNYHSLQRSSHL